MGFESSLSFLEYDQLDEELTSDLVPFTNIIEELRRSKDSGEQAKLIKAGKLADAAFNYIVKTIEVGQTEIEIADCLDAYIKDLGATNESFETIVASGVHSTWPHATVSNRKIQNQDLITIDFGYYYEEYTFDVTRTIVVGSISDELKKIYDVVLRTQEHVISLIKPGLKLSELARVANQMIDEAGYGAYFNHGIGLSIHELPNFRLDDLNGVLEVGDVITIEPGIYVPKMGGVRIEDDILVVETGFQMLTDSSKKLMII
ncbi:M24 family metallopeptidase [Dellaglioa sp. L3N]